MFDSRKIDSYFDSEKSPDKFPAEESGGRISWRRFFKLVLPCIAAALLGVMAVMPNIRKSTDLTDSVTVPHKNEMEKLHMEKTVFNSTDKQNRINKITADNVDETEPGSKILKIANPQGDIPTDSGMAVITSKEGLFNRNNNILDLYGDVRAVINGNTVITSPEAKYDFNTEKASGSKPVQAEGDWGKLSAEAFTYDKNTEILVLTGYGKITAKNGVSEAHDKITVYRKENKTVSEGNASVQQNGSSIYADKIVAFFSPDGKKELVSAEAYGNVKVITPSWTADGDSGYYDAKAGNFSLYGPEGGLNGQAVIRQEKNTLYADNINAELSGNAKKNLIKAVALGNVRIVTPRETVYASEGHYYPRRSEVILYGYFTAKPSVKRKVVIKQDKNVLSAEKVTAYLSGADNGRLEKAVATGGVEVATPKGSARGDRGIYRPGVDKVELFDNVRIEQDGNFIDGTHAETDLKTSVSRIRGGAATGGRIHGIFYKKRKDGK